MIETRYGNVLDLETGIIVHGCNCQGVMGSGIALEVKNRFPLVFHEYERIHRTQGLKLGTISYVEVAPNKFIVNAQTQNLYGTEQRPMSYDAMVDCFEEVLKFARAIKTHRNVKLDINFPLIGAVRGGGRWDIIEKIIDVIIPDDEFKKVLYRFEPTVGVEFL